MWQAIKNLSENKRYLLLFLLLLNTTLLVIFILSSDFYLSPNIKAALIFRKDIKIKPPHSAEVNCFIPGHARRDSAFISDGRLYLVFEEGDTVCYRKGKLAKILSNAKPGRKLAIYSLSNLNTLLVNKFNNQILYAYALSQSELDYLNEVLSIVRNPLYIDRMKYNDHVISERCEVLAVLAVIIQDKKLITSITRLLAVDLDILMDKRFFTWNSNHGLMQIRAMLNMSTVIADPYYSERISGIANERLNQLIDFISAEDGAVLEAASGYWYYIFRELVNIQSHCRLSNTNKQMLASRIASIMLFLSDMADNQGIIPAIGDSYDYKIADSIFQMKRRGTSIFSYSNSLCCFEEYYDDDYIKVLFLSLDNPPNVHKHPSDLQVMLAAPKQLFINTGVYQYDKSMNRRIVLSEEAQGTVRFENSRGSFKHSTVSIESINKKPGQIITIFRGVKAYEKGTIIREMTLFTNSDTILTIKDYSNPKAILISSFNLHPELHYKRIGDSVILGESEQIIITSKNRCEDDTIRLSNSYNKMINIKQIKYYGEIIDLVFKLNGQKINSQNDIYIKRGDQINCREELASILRSRYDKHYLSRKQLIISLSIFLLLEVTLIILLVGLTNRLKG